MTIPHTYSLYSHTQCLANYMFTCGECTYYVSYSELPIQWHRWDFSGTDTSWFNLRLKIGQYGILHVPRNAISNICKQYCTRVFFILLLRNFITILFMNCCCFHQLNSEYSVNATLDKQVTYINTISIFNAIIVGITAITHESPSLVVLYLLRHQNFTYSYRRPPNTFVNMMSFESMCMHGNYTTDLFLDEPRKQELTYS